MTMAQVEALLAETDPTVTVKAVLNRIGRPRKGDEKGSPTTFIGRGSDYLEARLRRDHPEIADRLDEFPSVKAAERAARHLAEARTSADLLTARGYADKALALARLVKAANETQNDCLLIVKRAELELHKRIEEGRARGEMIAHGRPVKINVANGDTFPASLSDIGVRRDQASEWAALAKAGGEQAVKEAIAIAKAEGRRTPRGVRPGKMSLTIKAEYERID